MSMCFWSPVKCEGPAPDIAVLVDKTLGPGTFFSKAICCDAPTILTNVQQKVKASQFPMLCYDAATSHQD